MIQPKPRNRQERRERQLDSLYLAITLTQEEARDARQAFHTARARRQAAFKLLRILRGRVKDTRAWVCAGNPDYRTPFQRSPRSAARRRYAASGLGLATLRTLDNARAEAKP